MSRNNGDEFRIRIATIAPFPRLLQSEWCPRPHQSSTTAPLQAVAVPHGAKVKWWGEYRGKLSDLRVLAEKSCRARALLRFMRMPYWVKLANDQWILGDLRFDRDSEIGFTEFQLETPDSCPPAIPPWIEPLAPLLAPSAEARSPSGHG